MHMLEVILAIVAIFLAFIHIVLWWSVTTYRNHLLLSAAVLVLGVDVVLMLTA